MSILVRRYRPLPLPLARPGLAAAALCVLGLAVAVSACGAGDRAAPSEGQPPPPKPVSALDEDRASSADEHASASERARVRDRAAEDARAGDRAPRSASASDAAAAATATASAHAKLRDALGALDVLGAIDVPIDAPITQRAPVAQRDVPLTATALYQALQSTPVPQGATPPPPAPRTMGNAMTQKSRLPSGARAAMPTAGLPPNLALTATAPPARGAPMEPSAYEGYARIVENDFVPADQDPRSTFSLDVDSASYSNLRRFLTQWDQLPPPDAVRIEEMVNYFRYDHPAPGPEDELPFRLTAAVHDAPWAPEHRLVQLGLKGREMDDADRPPANLVFLIDVSGSMQAPNKLALVKESLLLLADELRPDDSVSLVVYAGAAGLVLPPTPGDQKDAIRRAIQDLEAGGSTNGGAGIQLAYDTAERAFLDEGVNRVILATDGDFNVGLVHGGELEALIREQAEGGVFLTTLGFGMGNYQDATLELLADKGNGNYGYVDTLAEAEKLLVEQALSTLVTIAKDVKIQVEFNPAEVAAWRLIGYENRVLAHQDFADDRKDAGEIGAGHTVTALYEVVPRGAEASSASGGLRYQRDAEVSEAAASGELLYVDLRYKAPDGDVSRQVGWPVTDVGQYMDRALDDQRFAAAVAAFGMILRDSEHRGRADWDLVLELAGEPEGEDREAQRRRELVALVERARELATQDVALR